MSGYSYTQYADATARSIGRRLYYLDHYCPLRITESVMFTGETNANGDTLVRYCGDRFAYVHWDLDGAPRFEFLGEYAMYNREQDARREEAMKTEQEYTARRKAGRQ